MMNKLDKYVIEFVMISFFISMLILLVGAIFIDSKDKNEVKTEYTTSDNKPITVEPTSSVQRVCYDGIVYYSNYDSLPIAPVYDKYGKIVFCNKE